MPMKKNVYSIFVVILLVLDCQDVLAIADRENNYPNWFKNFYYDVQCDYSIAYGKENLLSMGGLLLGSGILANTGLDRSFDKFYQSTLKSHKNNQFFKVQKNIGWFNYLPVYLGSITVGNFFKKSPVGHVVYEWGYRTFRALLIASPQVTIFRRVLGAHEPNRRKENSSLHESEQNKNSEKRENKGSKWRLFHKGRSSCSGHTFNGALPFLSAAMMMDEPIYRYGLIIFSTLPGISRISDEKHYLSQVILGWGLAYLAVRAVDKSEKSRDGINIGAYKAGDGLFLSFKLNF
jgi:membrane-associated phospholipid phosphatase